MQMFHRDQHSWIEDVHLATFVRGRCGSEDLMYLLKRVLCQDKVNRHGDSWCIGVDPRCEARYTSFDLFSRCGSTRNGMRAIK